jgi:arginyl-tRNA synthetase
MVAVDGNTGPYLMYAHSRTRSILRKAAAEGAGLEPGAFSITTPQERALAFEILGLGSAIVQTADSSQPHRLCGQLYALATAFTAFFENCPVLKGGDERAPRLRMTELTSRALRQGLDLLGIAAPERM